MILLVLGEIGSTGLMGRAGRFEFNVQGSPEALYPGGNGQLIHTREIQPQIVSPGAADVERMTGHKSHFFGNCPFEKGHG